MSIKVVVADDEQLVRAGFRVLVDSAPDLTVVGEARDGLEAVEVSRATRPDVVLMDIRMPRLNGIEATRRIVADPVAAGARVIVLTTFDMDSYAFGALRAGASGFLLKDTPPAELLKAVRVVADGEALLAPSVTRRLVEEFVRHPEQAPPEKPFDGVTDREFHVLRLVARGLSNAEIADQLGLTTGTVKTHVSKLLMKLNARDRTQLVIAAYEGGVGRRN